MFFLKNLLSFSSGFFFFPAFFTSVFPVLFSVFFSVPPPLMAAATNAFIRRKTCMLCVCAVASAKMQRAEAMQGCIVACFAEGRGCRAVGCRAVFPALFRCRNSAGNMKF